MKRTALCGLLFFMWVICLYSLWTGLRICSKCPKDTNGNIENFCLIFHKIFHSCTQKVGCAFGNSTMIKRYWVGFFSKRASNVICWICGFFLIFRNMQNYLKLSRLPAKQHLELSASNGLGICTIYLKFLTTYPFFFNI